MEKKMTKKEIEAMNEKQAELRGGRNEFIHAIKEFWKDVDATIRYYKINEKREYLTYSADLVDTEKEKLLRRHESLEFVKLHYNDKDAPDYRTWDFIRQMIRTYEEMHNYTGEAELLVDREYKQDGFWNNDIIWTETQTKLYLRMCKKFGYKYLIFTNSSSGALEDITSLVKLGAKIVNICTTRYHKEDAQGLVFDLTEVKDEDIAE